MEDNEFKIYIKFDWPEASKWRMDIEKAWKTLIAFSKILKKYSKDCNKPDFQPIIKIEDISEWSTDLILSIIDTFQQHPIWSAELLYGSKLIFENFWIKAFFEHFMGTLGDQLALKRFSKNQVLDQWKIEWNSIPLTNFSWEKRIFDYKSWENYQSLAPYLNDLYNLEAWKEDIMKLWYRDWNKEVEVAEITTADKEYFSPWDNWWKFLDRLEEDFDEKHTVERRITWVFVDYYGLAHKYHFSFQARKNQDEIWKQKILCIIDPEMISQAIDYLKPENSHNVTIFWNAVLDSEWKVDKLKIKWISSDPDFNPNQTSIS